MISVNFNKAKVYFSVKELIVRHKKINKTEHKKVGKWVA